MIAPVRNGVAGDKAEWVSATDGKFFDDKPQLSPDGNTLYFYSSRDGHFCIWAQRLDATTKRPRGEPFAVQHFHDASMAIGSSSQHLIDLCVAKDKLVTNLDMFQGDIWKMKLD
jgi:eukaryotic-like serine/threonine-protein kinase